MALLWTLHIFQLPHAILSVGSWIRLGVCLIRFSKCELGMETGVSSFRIGVASNTYEKSKSRLSFSLNNHIHPPNCVHKGIGFYILSICFQSHCDLCRLVVARN